MAKIQIEDINIFESFGASIYNRNYFVKINHVSSVDVATEDSLIFLTGNLKKSTNLLNKTMARVVICNDETARNNIHCRHIQAKINALKEYKSQGFRDYLSEDFIHSLARARGVQVGCEYAESFEVVRLFI